MNTLVRSRRPAAWWSVLAAVAALATGRGCTWNIERGSEDLFFCGVGGTCPTGTRCVQGYCHPVESPAVTGPAVVSIAVTETVLYALLADGTVRAIGIEGAGAGSAEASRVEGVSDARAIVAGATQACALRTGGAVQCWRVGDSVAAAPMDPGTALVSLAAGTSHFCGVTPRGKVMCWGENAGGQLGDGTSSSREGPTLVADVGGAVSVTAGDAHTCALLATGGIRCWGANDHGQLGDGSREQSLVRVEVATVADATAVEAGLRHTCIRRADGRVSCWGALGTGAEVYLMPTDVPFISEARSLQSGRTSLGCAVVRGALRCWGDSLQETSGGEFTDVRTASAVEGVGPCAVLVNGSVSCLPFGGETLSVNATILPVGLSIGREHRCEVLVGGGVRCVGRNLTGVLGDGTSEDSEILGPVSGLGGAIAVSAGGQSSCALLAAGAVHCWGRMPGNGTMSSLTPVAVSGVDNALAVAAGGRHICSVLADGSVRCWGENLAGQLGDGSLTTRTEPVPVDGLGAVVAVAAGERHSCALLGDGNVFCWGANGQGQLGNGSFTDSPSPTQVLGIHSAVAIGAGCAHTCALLADGTVQCWGVNDLEQLGWGRGTTSMPIPVPRHVVGAGPLSFPENRGIAVGDEHSCILGAGGRVSCWGRNTLGELGAGSGDSFGAPLLVEGDPAVEIAAGGYTCARGADGTTTCWGPTGNERQRGCLEGRGQGAPQGPFTLRVLFRPPGFEVPVECAAAGVSAVRYRIEDMQAPASARDGAFGCAFGNEVRFDASPGSYSVSAEGLDDHLRVCYRSGAPFNVGDPAGGTDTLTLILSAAGGVTDGCVYPTP